MSDLQAWLDHGDNRPKALHWLRHHARLVPERVALEPTPIYNRRTRKLTVWMFVLNDKGEKVLTPKGSSKIKATVKVSVPPPWVQ
jgi:hypothetical protein